MIKHYKFGSSTAKRTDNCPAWPGLSEGVPRQESSYALFGTVVHEMLEQRALDDEYRFQTRLGKTVAGETVTREHIDMATAMWDATQQVLTAYACEEWEPEVTGSTAPDVGGTIDLIARSASKVIVLDYKTGFNQVSPEFNEQLLFAVAVCSRQSDAADLFEGTDDFVGVIIQPDKAGDIQVKEWVFHRSDVSAFWQQHQASIELARSGLSEPNPGDHCAFCPAAATRCPAKNGDALRALQMNPEDLAQLSENLALIGPLKEWCSAVEKAAYGQLEAGADVAGWKLVQKRATEKWKDADAMIKKLRTKLGGKRNLTEEKPLSPAAVRRLAKTRGVEINLEGMTSKESSGTTLAPESDKRQAVLSAEAFGAALKSIS